VNTSSAAFKRIARRSSRGKRALSPFEFRSTVVIAHIVEAIQANAKERYAVESHLQQESYRIGTQPMATAEYEL
jgi:hypothetical protein